MAAGATVMPSYEDFEPYCKWHREEGHDTLEVLLQVFKKEQLRVQINKLGIINITGERCLNGSKWSRFCKEIKVSKDCKANEIRAKFSGAILYIIMPKKTLLLPATSFQNQPALPRNNQENEQIKPKINSDNVSRESAAKELPRENTATAKTATMLTTGPSSYIQDLVLKLTPSKEIAVKATIGVAVAVLLKAFTLYKQYYESFHVKN